LFLSGILWQMLKNGPNLPNWRRRWRRLV